MSEYIEVLLDSNRGVYIPLVAREQLQDGWFAGLPDWVSEQLRAGPWSEDYWEAWERVLNEARYCDSAGRWWRLHQDGDLFAVRVDAPDHIIEDLGG